VFIRDFYFAVSDNVEAWGDAFKESTSKLRAKLIELEEKLDDLRATYSEAMINLDQIFFALDQALLAIPDLEIYNKATAAERVMMLKDRYCLLPDYEEMGDETAEKMVRIIRDGIISKTSSFREAFDIKNTVVDMQLQPYFVKRRIKDIAGNDATFVEIAWFVRKLISLTD
jgi:hypothetical protein